MIFRALSLIVLFGVGEDPVQSASVAPPRGQQLKRWMAAVLNLLRPELLFAVHFKFFLDICD